MSSTDEKDEVDVKKTVDFFYQVMTPDEIKSLKNARDENLNRNKAAEIFFQPTLAFLKSKMFVEGFAKYCDDNKERIKRHPEECFFGFYFTVVDKTFISIMTVKAYFENLLSVNAEVDVASVKMPTLWGLLGHKVVYRYMISLRIPYLAIDKLIALHSNKVNEAVIEAERQDVLKRGR